MFKKWQLQLKVRTLLYLAMEIGSTEWEREGEFLMRLPTSAFAHEQARTLVPLFKPRGDEIFSQPERIRCDAVQLFLSGERI